MFILFVIRVVVEWDSPLMQCLLDTPDMIACVVYAALNVWWCKCSTKHGPLFQGVTQREPMCIQQFKLSCYIFLTRHTRTY